MVKYSNRTRKILNAAKQLDKQDLSEEDLPSDDSMDSDFEYVSPSVSEDEGTYLDKIRFYFEHDDPPTIPVVISREIDQNTNDLTRGYANPNDNYEVVATPTSAESQEGDIATSRVSPEHTCSTNVGKVKSDSQTKIELKKQRKRKHNCVYCDISVYNFARHLERQHNDEMEVQKFLQMEKRNPQRKQIIAKIRKEGDFCSGESIPVQNKKFSENKEGKQGEETDHSTDDEKLSFALLPCIYCRGYYARKTLRRHVKRCYFNTKENNVSNRSRPQAEGQTLMAAPFGPNDPLRTSGLLKTLKADDISFVAKQDKIICEVARKYIKSHREKHLLLVARRYMRRLARLLIEVRNIEKDTKLQISSILHPSKFKAIIQATRTICCYDASKKAFGSPSLALQMGTLIKKAISAAYSIEIQKNFASPFLGVLDCMKKLLEEEWATEISTEAGQNLTLNRFNKPTLMPVAEDIYKMKTYLDKLISDAKTMLFEKNNDESAYKNLIEGSFCNLLLFNKRRVGELQRILLHTYQQVEKTHPSGDFEKLLSPTEKVLIKNLHRIVIRGKRGRGVPVLIDKSTQEGLELAIKCRNNFYKTYNPYLFGACHSESCISGYHIFRKHVRLSLGDEKKTSSLTSTKLRKHLATIAQILKMGNEDLEQLASFMGHTTKTHNDWYRLPSDIYQTAKVSKILLLAQNNSIEKYKGQSLADLEVDENILQEDLSDSEYEGVTSTSLQEAVIAPIDEASTITSVVASKKKKRIFKKWSPEEKKITTEFFKHHIRKKVAPKRGEVEKLVQKHPELFEGRNWQTIKVFVCNQCK